MTKEELLNSYFFIQDESGTANTIKVAKYEYSSPTLTLSYTTTPDNSSSWTSFTITGNEYKTISLPANSKVYFKGTQAFSSSKYNYITCTYNYSAGGNVMSLLYGDNFKGQTTINSSYAFAGLFYKSTTLVTAKNLCLPAMTLANNCYMSMFNGCTNLTEVPELPATTLVSECYRGLFLNCTSLHYIKADFINYNSNYFTDWVKGISSTGTFVMNPNANYNPDNIRGINGIPTGWTVKTNSITPGDTLETTYFYIKNESENENTIIIKKKNTNSPTLNISYSTDMSNWSSSLSTTVDGININLPANGKIYFKCTTNSWNSNNNINLFNYINCTNNYSVGGNIMSLLYGNDFFEKDSFPNTNSFIFNKLFYKSLNLISCKDLILPVTKLNDYCYSSMFFGCRNLIDTPTISATTLAKGCYIHMFTSCVSLTELPTLNITNLTNSCYHGMFMNCDNISSISLPTSNLANYCYSNMFLGSDNLTEATINTSGAQNNSLNGMFKKCSTLNKVTIPYDNNINSTNLTNWLKDVADEGNFIYKSSSTQTESVVRDKYLVPNNWTVTRTS